MDQREKLRLDNQLLAMGLPKLNDSDLIQRLADLVSDWRGDRHEFLRDLLNECDSDKRGEMYNAIAPKLRFKALPLVQYEMQIAEIAGKMVSQRRMRVEGPTPKPIQVGRDTFIPVPQADADKAIATVRCCKCSKADRFIADTAAGAMIEARNAGWKREPGVNKEVCPDCQAKEAAQELITLSRSEVMAVTDKRRVN